MEEIYLCTYLFLIFRALLNSPLIRRKKKSHNNSSDIDCEENAASKCQASVKGEKKKNTPSLSVDPLIDDDPYAFNLLMNDDSESDDDSFESQESPLGTSSQASKETRGVYHNLETFQKRQLKQKV